MLGRLLYVFLLLTNALAVLSEDRFLARSTFWDYASSDPLLTGLASYSPSCRLLAVGWGSAQAQPVNQGFGQPYAQQYDQQGYAAGQDVGVKGRLINLISAVRTLMRSKHHLSLHLTATKTCVTVPLIGLNLVIIIYELLLGG